MSIVTRINDQFRSLLRTIFHLSDAAEPRRNLTISDCSEFTPVASIDSLLDSDAASPHRIYRHDSELLTKMTPHGLTRGVNVFGNGEAPTILSTPQSDTLMRSAFSFAIDDGVLLPKSMAIVTQCGRLTEPSISNATYWGGLEYIEPLINRDSDGTLFASWNDDELCTVDAVAVSPFGIGHQNYGHFLFDGLPLSYLLMNSTGRHRSGNVAIVTPSLTSWQREILDLLGLSQYIFSIEQPTRFRTLIGNSFLSQHVWYTTRYARTVFDALKFAVSAAQDAPEKIFIVRAHQNYREMRNLESVKTLLAGRGYTLVQPERHSIRDQIRLFSRARIVIGETGAGLANICFSPPGVKLLQIMPECYPDPWVRSCCHLFGHRWHVYLCKVLDQDRPGLQVGGAFHPGAGFSFELPLDAFSGAIDAVEAA